MISTADGEMTCVAPNGSEFFCPAAVSGTLWRGQIRGITEVRGFGPYAMEVLWQSRLDGAVRFIFPLLRDGGAAHICEEDDMGAR